MKKAENIFNFPIVNDSKAIGLLKKFRSECLAATSNNKANNMGINGMENDLGN